jgi:hypothetical protein
MEKQLHHLLNNKNLNLDELKKLCRDHKPFLDELIDNLKEKNETIRYNSVRILTRIAEEEPDKIYPYWNILKEHLYSKNIIPLLTGIILISRIIVVDKHDYFKSIEDDFFNLINHKNVIPVRYLLLDIWRIGKARPEYIPRIREILFSIDGINQEHKGLLKGDALLAFAELWDLLNPGTKKKVVDFAKDLLKSESPKTKKEAKNFLKKYSGQKD